LIEGGGIEREREGGMIIKAKREAAHGSLYRYTGSQRERERERKVSD
jgi:hypothetical protein